MAFSVTIPDGFWVPAETILAASTLLAGVLRYGARIMCWLRQAEIGPESSNSKIYEAVEALERRTYFERAEMEKRLDSMERAFATKEELAAVEQRLRGAMGDLRDDVRFLAKAVTAHSQQTTENLHTLIGDVAEIKGHLGRGAYTQKG
jgi:hypothetical protein